MPIFTLLINDEEILDLKGKDVKLKGRRIKHPDRIKEVVYFDGSADIGIMGLIQGSDDEMGIYFTQLESEKRNIGDRVSKSLSSTRDVKVSLMFKKPESIDVLIKSLEDVKEALIK